MADYYEILGLKKGADAAAIKLAYHKLAKQYHPDINKDDPKAEEKFKEIGQAYDILSDENKKQMYDNFGTADPHQAGGFGNRSAHGFEHVFRDVGGMEDFFSQFSQQFGGRQTMKNPDLRAQMNISLNDAFNGVTVPFEITQPSGGTNNLQVNIPAGVETGSRIRLKGKGSIQNTNLPPGDMFVDVIVNDHLIFKRMGADLFVSKNITISDAILGKEFEIDLIEGTTAKVQVPPGTQPGQRIRLRQKGMPILNRSGRGDLYLVIKVIIPSSLTEKQKDLIQQFEEESKKIAGNA